MRGEVVGAAAARQTECVRRVSATWLQIGVCVMTVSYTLGECVCQAETVRERS